MSSGKEVDLLVSFLGKLSEIYKVSVLADTIESNNGPLWWSLPIRNSVLCSARVESSNVVLCQSSRPRSLQEVLEHQIFSLTHLLCEEYDTSKMTPDRFPGL